MKSPDSTVDVQHSLRERKRRRTREDIVDTAYRLFARHGYDAVSVTDIVDAAEVSRSTFFRYFGDKQEVVFSREHELRESATEREWQRKCPPPQTFSAALGQLRTIVVDTYRQAQESPRHKAHERLIDKNPELHDRHVRKLLGFAQDMTKLLEHRGAPPDTAVLAAHTAVACCLAARKTATQHSTLADAIDACFQRFGERR